MATSAALLGGGCVLVEVPGASFLQKNALRTQLERWCAR